MGKKIGMKKKTHGGFRPGAGRKPAGTVKMLVSPKAETARKMKDQARAERITVGQLLDRVFS